VQSAVLRLAEAHIDCHELEFLFFFFQAEDGIRDFHVTGVQTCALPIYRVSATSDEIVTQVLDVHNVSAAQLVPMLRPMIAQYGHLAAYPASNILIISDHASNVNRMMRIIQRIDQVMNQDVEIVPLQNASAAEV